MVLQRLGVNYLEVNFVVQPDFFSKLLEDARNTTPDYGFAIAGFAARVGTGQAVVFIRHTGRVVGQHRLILAVEETIADK